MANSDKGLHIPSLDGLRCVAVLLVFASHAMYDANLKSVIPGSLGVTIFFFLSGYLITTLLRVEYDRCGSVDIRKFFLRRVLRIFPPFYIVLLIAVLWGLYFDAAWSVHMDPGLVTWQALHFTNYLIAFSGFDISIAPGTDVLWSLAVEEHFYVLFPWVFILLMRMGSAKSGVNVLIGICVLFLLWRLWLIVGLGATYERTYVATDSRADSILFGCILGLWWNPALDRPIYNERYMKWVLFPIGMIGLIVTSLIPSVIFQSTVRYSLQGICLFPVFIVCIKYPNWGGIKILNLRVVQWLGLLSYTIYLVHRVVLMTVWTYLRPNFWLYAPVALAVTIGFAAGMYYLIERPAARLRRKLSAASAETTEQPSLLNSVR